MSHTPGPWNLETVRTQCGICHKVGPFPPKSGGRAERHACMYADYPSNSDPADQELLANARLIASAPDLLEALIAAEKKLCIAEQLLDLGEDDSIDFESEILNARAAIAKATGQ